MSDLEMLAALNHVELSRVEEALRRDVRCMVLREVCEYMKKSPENSLRIRRLYHRHDNLRAAQIAAQVVCNCRLSEEDLAWLDCCIRRGFSQKAAAASDFRGRAPFPLEQAGRQMCGLQQESERG